jgi:hypothetical protein
MISQAYGVSHQGLHQALKKAGLVHDPWINYPFPWKHIASQDRHTQPLRYLRYAYRMKVGKPVPDSWRRQVVQWVQWLEASNLVVDYAERDGFVYVPRRDSDTWLLRNPEPPPLQQAA